MAVDVGGGRKARPTEEAGMGSNGGAGFIPADQAADSSQASGRADRISG
jgi:hypothetical protein